MSRRPLKNVRPLWRRVVGAFVVGTLSMVAGAPLALLTSMATPAQAAINNKCDGTSVQNNLTVTANHGSVFYIDSSNGQQIDASYAAYKITNTGATSKTDLWASVDGFTGGVVRLSNPLDANAPIGALTGGSASKTAFFFLKAVGTTSTAQSHVVHVYEGKPGTALATEIYSCSFSFVKVAETIKAKANKVTNIAATSSSVLGSEMTVTVTGNTGTVGAGSSTDPSIFWLSPAARSTWPSQALRLERTSISVYSDSAMSTAIAGSPFTDLLKVPVASGSKYYYRALYTFRIVGQSALASTSVFPVAQIASGTQTKHTDLSALPSGGNTTTLSLASPSTSVSVTKSLSSTVEVSSTQSFLSYTVTLTNRGAATTVDQVVDTPDSKLTFVPGSALFDGTQWADASPSAADATKLVFTGPMSVAAGSDAAPAISRLTYKMALDSCSGTYSLNNSAVATIGATTVGSGANTYSLNAAGGTCGQTTLTTNATTNTTLPIEALTSPASSVTAASATLNGVIDPNGTSGQPVTFKWSTSSTLASSTTVTLSNTTSSTSPYAVSTNLTGLTAGTTYYFQVTAGAVSGEILSFSTPEVAGTPVAITRSATGVDATGQVTFNGSVDPNQVANGTQVKFKYAEDTGGTKGLCSAQGTATTTAFLQEEDANGSLIDMNLTGAYPSDVSLGTTISLGSPAKQYFCYQVIAYTGSPNYTTVASTGSWVPIVFKSVLAQVITFTTDASYPLGSTPSMGAETDASGLAITYTSNSTDVCTVSSLGVITTIKVGVCSITASQAGNTDYSVAEPVTNSFYILTGQTITFSQPSTKTVGDSFSAGATSDSLLPVSYSSSTPSVCTVDPDTGLVTAVGPGSCTITASQSGSSFYSAASDVVRTFTIENPPPATYTVTYADNGATTAHDGGDSTYVTGSSFTLPSPPARDGFSFGGWQLTGPNATTASVSSSATTATPAGYGNVTLTAQWTAVSYTVTYVDNGATTAHVGGDVTYSTGSAFDLPTAPSRNGYSFTGWQLTGTNVTTASVSSSATSTTPAGYGNVTLTAQWTASPYTVTYVDNGATTAHSGGASTYSTGSSFTLPTAPARTGYTFGGWQLTGANVTTASVSSSATSAAPSGFGNVTLTAQWTAVSYSVTYMDNGATTAHSGGDATYTTGNAFTLPTAPGRTGYTFAGWELTGTNAAASTIVSSATSTTPAGYGNVTLTAQWTAISYSVTYVGNGATTAHSGGAGTYNTGTSFTLPTPPSRSGYTFAGWQLTGTNATTATILSSASSATPVGFGDVTLTAQWTVISYTVTYVGNGATTAHVGGDATYSTGSSFTLPSAPSRSGYTFAGWQLTGTNATTATILSSASSATPVGFGNVTLTAQWTAISYTVIYVDNGATTAHSGGAGTYNTGSSFTLPTAPSRSGYTFAGWQLTGTNATMATILSFASSATPAGYGDVTLTAQWTAASFTVTYDDNGATTPRSGGATSYVTDSSFVLPSAPARNGYTFGGWQLTGANATTAPIPSSATSATPVGFGNVTLTAQWTAVSYTVTYVDNDATTAHSGGDATYTTGSSFSLPTAPLRTDYTFVGWRLTGVHATTATLAPNATTATPAGYGNLTLTAQWSTGDNIVTYVGNGATTAHTGGDNSYAVGNSFTLPTPPARTGYSFAGWQLTGANVTTSTIAASATTATPAGFGNVTLTAQWTPLTFVVQYNPNGGSGLIANVNFTVGGPSMTAASGSGFTRSGYTFVTWNTSPNGTGTTIRQGSTFTVTGNTVLYAIWQFVPTPAVSAPPRTPPASTVISPSAAPIVVAPRSTPQGIPLAQPRESTSSDPGSIRQSFDVGDGTTNLSGGMTALQAATNDSARRSVSDMQSESVGGFSEGSSVVIRVSGARTAGQFLVSDAEILDAFAVAAALSESLPRKSADFAQINGVRPVASLDWSKVTTGELTTDALDLFTASGLGTPRTLADVPADEASNWLEITAGAAGFVPGSVVYLAVTTEPLIFGSAQVDADGNARLEGMLPINVLEPGAHNIRIVGTRDLGGVTVNSDGTLLLSDSTMAQIQRFDRGSNAVVELSGKGADGLHAAVRLIPLVPNVPWPLLWFLIGGLFLLLAIRQWKFRSRFAVGALWASAIAGVTAIEIVVWVEEAYVMLAWVPVAAGLVLGLDVLISIFRRYQSSTDEATGIVLSRRGKLSAAYSNT